MDTAKTNATTPDAPALILASGSASRLNVLRTAGIKPIVRVSGVDEDAIAATVPDGQHDELVITLARAKAEAVIPLVSQEFREAIIIGCDSMLERTVEGRPQVVGKPGTADVAAARWREMGGSSGELISGHAVLRVRHGEVVKRAERACRSEVQFAKLNEDEIASYVETGEPLGVAGGFTLEGFGGWFIDAVSGDPSNVLGISLPATRDLLAAVDISVISLWRST